MTLSTWLGLLAMTFGAAGGLLALRKIRYANTQRSRETALQLLRSFLTPEFLKAVNIVFELPEGLSKREIERRLGEGLASLRVMFGTFEKLGILVLERDVDIDLVRDFFSGILLLTGKKLQNYLDEVRALGNPQPSFEWYEWLFERIQ